MNTPSQGDSLYGGIIPQKLKRFCHNRINEAFGVILILLTATILLSLYWYDPNEASVNFATGLTASSPLGSIGAAIADWIIQIFGFGSLVIALLSGFYGYSMIVTQAVIGGYRRFFTATLTVVMACGLIAEMAAAYQQKLPNGYGGYIGLKIAQLSDGLLNSQTGVLFMVFYMTLMLVSFCSALGISARQFLSLLQLLVFAITALLIFLISLPVRLIRFSTLFISIPFFNWLRNLELTGTLKRLQDKLKYFSTKIKNVFYSFCNYFSNRFELQNHQQNEYWQKKPLNISIPGNESEKIPFPFNAPLPNDSENFADDALEDENNEKYLNQEIAAKMAKISLPQAIIKDEVDKVDSDENLIRQQESHNEDCQQQYEQGEQKDDEVFDLPGVHLLMKIPVNSQESSVTREMIEKNVLKLLRVLKDFGVNGEIIEVRSGPVVTLYELEPAPGIKSSRIIGLADDIARSMSAISARVAVLPGRNALGIELPNENRQTVYLRELIHSEYFNSGAAQLPLVLGKDIAGEPVIADLARMPHLLIAGTTGSGKSVGVNAMLLSILYALPPEDCRLILIDPKMLELSVYDDIPHLLTPVVTDPKKAVGALQWAVIEMERRYKLMSKYSVRNIHGYNAKIAAEETMQQNEKEDKLPYIIVVIDEMADLMMVAGKKIETAIQRLAQMARAAGIHIITATQRPSVDVVTGTIKANFPTRISFQVTSKIDSRTILGEQGAEQLLGQGDMLFMEAGGKIKRVHGPFVSDKEVESVVKHLKKQKKTDYREGIITENSDNNNLPEESLGDSDQEGGLYSQAIEIVARDRKASTSYLQRRLSIGYNRAASLIERMENEGLIGAADHAGRREIFVAKKE